MLETPEEMARLQDLLDSSMDRAGPHLRGIITERRRLLAPELTGQLQGMRLLVLATVTAGRAARWRMRTESRPAVSATHLPGDELAVTVHGRAEILALDDPASQALRQAMLDEYLPKQGPSFEEWLDDLDGWAARIEPEKMFTFHTDS